jgi:acyl-CoA dehydrogenase
MEYSLMGDELALIKKTVRSFIKEYVEQAEQREGSTMEILPTETVRALQGKAKDMGLWFLGADREWGGAGLSFFEQAVLYEQASQHRLGIFSPGGGAFGQDLPKFLQGCTSEQLEKYVKPSIQTGNGCYVAVWEPYESNDLQNMNCKAVKYGDKWVIDGIKSYVPFADTADFGIVLVNCLTEDGEEKPTLFIVEQDESCHIVEQTLIDVLPTYQITYTNYTVEDQNRIGEIGEGNRLIEQWHTETQLLMAARCIGICKHALEITQNYVSLRITRGKTLSEFQSVRTVIAQFTADLHAAKLAVWDATRKLDDKKKDGGQAAKIANLLAVQAATRVVDNCLQFHGGAGFTRDLPFERWYKELRIARLLYGETEMLLEKIATGIFD